jgi:hypothetical protein
MVMAKAQRRLGGAGGWGVLCGAFAVRQLRYTQNVPTHAVLFIGGCLLAPYLTLYGELSRMLPSLIN